MPDLHMIHLVAVDLLFPQYVQRYELDAPHAGPSRTLSAPLRDKNHAAKTRYAFHIPHPVSFSTLSGQHPISGSP